MRSLGMRDSLTLDQHGRDTSNGALKQTLDGPGGGVDWVQWHPRGAVLLAGSEDFTAWLWNATDGTCMQACVRTCLLTPCALS